MNGEAAPDATGRHDADAPRISKPEVVQGEHRIACEDGLFADSEHRLHELVPGSGRDVLEAVQALADMLEATALVELAQLHRGHAEIVRVLGGDVAVLVERPLVEPAAVGVSHRHSASIANTVPLSVRF